MAAKKIIYSRGFPYGAPLAMLRGGGTKDETVKSYLKSQHFMWDGAKFCWYTYLNRRELGALLKKLRDEYGCTIVPKDGMDANYLINLDDPEFHCPTDEQGVLF